MHWYVIRMAPDFSDQCEKTIVYYIQVLKKKIQLRTPDTAKLSFKTRAKRHFLEMQSLIMPYTFSWNTTCVPPKQGMNHLRKKHGDQKDR